MKEQPTHSHHVRRRLGEEKMKRKQAQPAHRPTIESFSDFILSRVLWFVRLTCFAKVIWSDASSPVIIMYTKTF